MRHAIPRASLHLTANQPSAAGGKHSPSWSVQERLEERQLIAAAWSALSLVSNLLSASWNTAVLVSYKPCLTPFRQKWSSIISAITFCQKMYLAGDIFESTLLCIWILQQLSQPKYSFSWNEQFMHEHSSALWTHFIGGAVQLTLQITEPKLVVPVWNYRAHIGKWYPLSAAE